MTVTSPAATRRRPASRTGASAGASASSTSPVEAEVSARHLSFVETGRSRPSRELVLHLAEHLDVPLRERNSLLLAAGYAPSYRRAVARHRRARARPPGPRQDPDRARALPGGRRRPALEHRGGQRRAAVVARVAAVSPRPARTAGERAADRRCIPTASRPTSRTSPSTRDHLLARLDRQAADDRAATTSRAGTRSCGRTRECRGGTASHEDVADRLFVPLVLRIGDGPTLTFFSTIATFGTALDVTVAELAIEQFFPADAATAAALTS